MISKSYFMYTSLKPMGHIRNQTMYRALLKPFPLSLLSSSSPSLVVRLPTPVDFSINSFTFTDPFLLLSNIFTDVFLPPSNTLLARNDTLRTMPWSCVCSHESELKRSLRRMLEESIDSLIEANRRMLGLNNDGIEDLGGAMVSGGFFWSFRRPVARTSSSLSCRLEL